MIRPEADSRPLVDIEQKYQSLEFTQTSGYNHYAPTADNRALRQSSIDRFLADEMMAELHIELTRYSPEEITQTASVYNELLMELAAKSPRTPEEDSLMDKIINKTGELFRYEELLLSLGATVLEDRSEHRRLAADLSLEIMGGVNKPAFNTLVNELLDTADTSALPIAAELKELLMRQEVDIDSQFSRIDLEDTTRKIIEGDLYELYPGLEKLMEAEDSGPVGSTEAVETFKSLQQLAGLDDWDTDLDDGKSAHTSSKDRKVFIGRNRAALKNHKETVALGMHEAIVHGSRAGGVQVADTLDFEEGLATRLQQILSGEKRTPGVQYYLSIGLQAGADRNGEMRSYRETFEIMWRREVLLQEKAGTEIDISAARVLAQRQVTRTRRGGAIDTRDSSYFVGAQKAAQWLNELSLKPADVRLRELKRVLTNRIDPTIPEHIAMTQEVE